MPKLRQVIHRLYISQYFQWIFVLPSLAILALLALPILPLLWRAGVEWIISIYYTTQCDCRITL